MEKNIKKKKNVKKKKEHRWRVSKPNKEGQDLGQVNLFFHSLGELLLPLGITFAFKCTEQLFQPP